MPKSKNSIASLCRKWKNRAGKIEFMPTAMESKLSPSRRDFFAGMALVGIIMSNDPGYEFKELVLPESYAKNARLFADAMLKELEKEAKDGT